MKAAVALGAFLSGPQYLLHWTHVFWCCLPLHMARRAHAGVTTIVSNGLYSFYNHFNCVLIESRRFSNLETNPKLEGSFLEFYSVAIGWFPELDRHSGFVAENQWPLFADTISTHNTFRHGEIDGIQADQYVYYSKTCTTEIFFQQGVRRSFPVKTIQTFVGREFNKVVFTFSDFRTVDGISFKLPFKVVREVFLTGSITASAYTKYQLSEFNVLSSEGNPFRLMDEPGRVTIDLDSGTQIACPGGQALMSKVCNHCKAHFGARFLRRGQSIETCVFIGLFSCAIAVCWLFSRPRQE
ncbi:MAG: hypothetical protein ACK6DB_11795 [Planctomycetota bacterium]